MPTDTSREVILSRIRTALLPNAGQVAPEVAWASIPRAFRNASDASAHEVIERLRDRLHDYDAQVLDATPQTLTEAIAKMAGARGVRRIVVPDGFPVDALPEGFEYIADEALTAAQLDAVDGVITQCTLAIAETGTIVLQNVPGQGRRAATLVPDYHLCVVETGRVVATVPEAIAALEATAKLPTTFISGPSATADIEMTRIKGVHGPRFLDVILLSS